MHAKTAPILVVEDDQAVREVLRSALQGEGWAVLAAADGEQSLARSRYTRPALVLLDWNLPGVRGAALAAALRQHCGDGLAILLVSAEDGLVEKGRQVGACATLAKPFDLEELFQVIHQVLDPAPSADDSSKDRPGGPRSGGYHEGGWEAIGPAQSPNTADPGMHAWVRARLTEDLEAALPAPEQACLADHLARCAPCGAFARTLQCTLELVHQLPRVGLPPAVRRQLQGLAENGPDGN